ncbi:MAG: RND transporter [Gammaproteobacteria bacterium]|nr:MAG: RND transporter [Gammaproteobacteria bacterium]
MSTSFSERLLNLKYLVVILALGICLSMGYGVTKIKLATDYRVFFSEDNPWLLEFEKLEKVYTKVDALMFVITAKDGNVFTKNTLESVVEATDRVWQLPFVIRTDSISNFQYTEVDEDDLLVEDLVLDEDLFQGPDLQQNLDAIKSAAMGEPLLVKRLISEKGDVTAVVATINMPGIDQANELPSLIKAARELKAELEHKYPKVEFRISGNQSMNNAFGEASKSDMTTLYPITFLVIFLGLLFFYRNFNAMLATVVVIFSSIAFGLGALGWLGIPGSPPVLNSAIMIMTLAVADCLHVTNTFFHLMSKGNDKRKALIESLRINLQPIFLTSLTTVIGFLTLNFAEGPPFQDLGNVVAIGVTAAFILSLTLLPALLMILPMPTYRKASTESKLMLRFADWVIEHNRRLFYSSGTVILALVLLIPLNELNDIWIEYFDESMEARQNIEYTRDNLTGINTIQYSLGSGEENGINNTQYLANVEKFANWFEQQPETYHVNVFNTVLKKLNQNLNQDDPAFYKLPENKQLAAQYTLLYELSLPQGLDLNNQINVDKSAMRLVVTLQQLSTKEMLALEQRATSWLKANTPEYMHSEGTSSDLIFAHIGMSNVVSMMGGTSIALVIISLILIVALRSFKYGLVSFVPNLAPAAMGFGIWALIDGTVGMGLSVVVGMTLGIVVDDTVHFLSKYLRARREQGLNAKEAVRYSFETVGVALSQTTIILVLGFSVMIFSTFTMNADNGLLTSITIAMALIVDFLFLPGLLIMVDKKTSKRFSKICATNATSKGVDTTAQLVKES